MSDRLADLGADTRVALITFTDPTELAGYRTADELSFPVLVDPDRESYRAYGLGRGSIARIWGWRAARRYLEIVRAEGVGRLARPTEDTRQLGGDFVVDRDGRLVFGFWGAGPDDRPSVDALVDAVRRSGS